MSDMLQASEGQETRPEAESPAGHPAEPEALAVALGKLLAEHRGGDVVALDMRPLDFWTDFFVIATVTSGVHQGGLERVVKEYAREHGLPLRAPPRSEGWHILDLGNVVAHLMTAESRGFYELERLWSGARVAWGAPPPTPPAITERVQ